MAKRKVFGNLQSALIPVVVDTRPAYAKDLTQEVMKEALGGSYKTGFAARVTPGMLTSPASLPSYIKDRFDSLHVQGSSS